MNDDSTTDDADDMAVDYAAKRALEEMALIRERERHSMKMQAIALTWALRLSIYGFGGLFLWHIVNSLRQLNG